jgi:hypothetical protein
MWVAPTERKVANMEKELATVSGGGGSLTATDIRKQVNLIQSVMKEVMIDGQHYGKVPGCGDKPALLKSGAEKIAMTFRLGSEFDELPGSVESDSFICYKIDCKLFHIPTGNVVGHGRGTASSKEKKNRTRSVSAYKATDEEKAIGKLEQRPGKDGKPYDVYIIPQDPWDIQNTIYKMACKRAQVAAILSATGASDIFTQDIEDLPEGTIDAGEDYPKQSQKPHVEPPKQKQTPPPASSGETISEPQGKRLFAIAMGAGMGDPDTFRVWLKEQFGYDSSKHILKAQYEEICTAAKDYSNA